MSDDLKSLSEQVPDTHFRVNGSATLGMIGSSAPMRALFASLPRIASLSSPLCNENDQITNCYQVVLQLI